MCEKERERERERERVCVVSIFILSFPYSLAINRVATYKQLESDLHQHTFTLVREP